MQTRRGPPFTIRQVRGASYPPLTAPPSRGGGRAAPAGTPAAAPSAGAPSGSRASPAPAPAPTAAPAAAAPSTSSPAAGPAVILSREAQRLKLFDSLLKDVEVVDLAKLRPASWSGIPEQHRPVCWQLLLGYLPSNPEWRADTLQRKRREYWASVPQYFDVDDAERSQYQKDTLHQILMDVPRTSPSSRLLHHEVVQRALERILYIWALRHPASGYVQGINDLVSAARRRPTSPLSPPPPPPTLPFQVTPFFVVFLSDHLPLPLPLRLPLPLPLTPYPLSLTPYPDPDP
jgi:hypothetical protein